MLTFYIRLFNIISAEPSNLSDLFGNTCFENEIGDWSNAIFNQNGQCAVTSNVINVIAN